MVSGRNVWRATGLLLATSLVLTACWGDDDEEDGQPSSTTTTVVTEPVVSVAGATSVDATELLGIRLSEGAAAGVTEAAVPVVDGSPLDDDEVAALLDRLPAWVLPPDEGDGDEFVRPPETLTPPVVGGTVDAPFPPPGDVPPDQPPAGPLEVLRYQPEGDVDVAPFLTVTFDQPMVPLATLDQLDAADVPVVVTPELTDGRWRWIGTRTLRFDPDGGALDRLPGATEYRAEVPAGTRAVNGSTLADTVSWTFTTPPVSVTDFVGDDETTTLTPILVATFDQRVDPTAVLATTELSTAGATHPLRLATTADVEADDEARRAVAAALDGRAVAFRPSAALPADTAFTVRIGPGTPSAEGPLTTETASTFTGRTFGGFDIEQTTCDWGDGCVPGTPFVVEFTNAIDPDAFSADLLTVDPAIPGLRISVSGSVIEFAGATEGRTTYEVTFDAELTDVFGQTLGTDRTVSFDVGSSPPALRGLDRQWITTDPNAERPTVTVTSINHDDVRVRAWSVSPANLTEFREYLERYWSDDRAEPPEAWNEVLDETVAIDAEPDRWVETAIDLEDAFELAGSQLVVRIDPTLELTQDDEDYWRNRPTIAWVQRTTLGIDAFLDGEHLVIWTTDLRTGEPVERVPVELIGDGRVAPTDSEGLAELELGEAPVLGLWANAGDRTAFLVPDWSEGWQRWERSDEARWYVFDDRGIYRPGETARIAGWVRNLAWSQDGQLALWEGATAVRYQVWDPQGIDLGSGTADLNRLGGFNFGVEIPEGANLGQAWVELSLDGIGEQTAGSHTFQIQEFRRPEFEVTARAETPGPYYVADPATVAVDAEYFAGGPLPDAEVDWLVTTRETSYSPPNWDDYTFGIWTPWWYADVGAAEVAADLCIDCGPFGDVTYEELAGRTDADGTHYLQLEFDGPSIDLPSAVTAEATVFDVNRQAWASRTDLLVHAARSYVGLRTDRPFVERGTPIRVDAVVTDVDGELAAGRPVEVVAGRVEWVDDGDDWVEVLADEQTCVFSSTDDPTDGSMGCEFPTEIGGQYRITAVVTDDRGDSNRTELTQWVTGGEARPSRNVEQQEVTIVPDAERYEPGDTAELLVQAPFAPAHGVVNVIRGGIVATEAFVAEDGSAVVEIPIADEWIPNVTIQVDMVGATPRTADDGSPLPDLPPRPAYATGRAGLQIPALTRTLDVTATPAERELEPGSDTSVTVEVTDPDGEPVADADVALVVVDEAVLSLTGYELADPIGVFYADIWADLLSQYVRSSIVLARPDLVEGEVDLVTRSAGGDEFAVDDAVAEAAAEEPASVDLDTAGAGDGATIDVRSNFEALAVYAPSETTGEDGTVTVDVPVPDSLTRYRVMAVAVDGETRFGAGESTITARLPLMVRPSAPRFLNYGDRFELPVVVQNQTGEPLDVDVVLQTSNLEPAGAAGVRVAVPANDRVEVRFPLSTDEVGSARFRVVATAGDEADAATGSMPVYTPATTEAFATYGVVDEGAIGQPIVAPTDVVDAFGGLEIGTSSTAVQALTDAVLYLVDYPYESTDGVASRIMAVAALRDILDAFDAEGLPDPGLLDVQVRTDIVRLQDLQNDDGGWPWFQRGRESIPFQSIQAAHALLLAEQAGYPVAETTSTAALRYLASIEEHFPADYGPEVRNTLSAYALHVRQLAGPGDPAKAQGLYEREGDELGLDALAWLWPSIIDPATRDEIATRIDNAAVETAGAAVFATEYSEDAYVIAQSERRTDGIVLDALITEQPDSDLIPKVVTGLIGNQTNGHWNNAYENSFILVALHRYFETFEEATPDFVARAWLGDLYAVENEFRGRETERVNTIVPMGDVVAAGDTTLVLSKDGDGRLYYRLGLRYAPSDLELAPRDEGFAVERIYEPIDDPGDVTRDADGTWRIRPGANVRVRVTMIADAARTGVALVDPLPAGLEAVNPALSVSTTVPPGEDEPTPLPIDDRWWGWPWFEHQNLRDDRAEAFASRLPGGAYEYTYVARATTPGEFVVPPAKAEEMYSPEVFGRSATDAVIVG
jgi:uncharacterized protein YfaS (alpha-2-macroglobulin family)